jgi:hypothetical protein
MVFSPQANNTDWATTTCWRNIQIVFEATPYNYHQCKIWGFQGVTKKNGVFWDVTPCGSCNSRRFGGT